MSLIETFKLKRHAINHLAGLTMTEQFCTAKLHEFEQFVLQKRDSMLAFCVLHLAFSVVVTLGNLSGFRPRLSQLRRSRAVTLQRKIRDCSQSKCLTIY